MNTYYKELAKTSGFQDVSLIRVEDIVFEHSFRQFCEQNLCGSYGRNYACPPYCGSPEEMEEKVRKFTWALVLKTDYRDVDALDGEAMKPLKKKHTQMTLDLIEKIRAGKEMEDLAIMAGPCGFCTVCGMEKGTPCPFDQKRFSCLSAYCIDVSKLAMTCGMEISWAVDRASFFSLYIY